MLFIWLVGVLVFLFESCSEPRQVKYVFYFIGDGMGVNQVNGTEMFLAELDSVIGVKGLNFASFPVRNYATTYSSYNGVTCSAAAGTAAQAVRPCPFLLHKKKSRFGSSPVSLQGSGGRSQRTAPTDCIRPRRYLCAPQHLHNWHPARAQSLRSKSAWPSGASSAPRWTGRAPPRGASGP